MLVIDPMHNLFLGSAKHFLKSVLLPKISNNQFDIIQARIDFFKVPPDLGRIPNKIHSGFASFTVEQWKNWTVYFSVASMHDILDKRMLETLCSSMQSIANEYNFSF